MTENFQDKLDQYKRGEMPLPEANEVRLEIEKFNAIQTYLDEEEKLDFAPDFTAPSNKKIKIFKRKLTYRYALIAIICIVSIFLVGVIGYYSIGGLLSKRYHIDDATAFSKETISNEIRNLTTYKVSEMTFDNSLFGRYSRTFTLSKFICNTKINEFKLKLNYSLGKLVSNPSNRAENWNNNLISCMVWNDDFYLSYGPVPDQEITEHKFRGLKGFDELATLPDKVKAEVYLSFNKPVPISQVFDQINIKHDGFTIPPYDVYFFAVNYDFAKEIRMADGKGISSRIPIIGCYLYDPEILVEMSRIPAEYRPPADQKSYETEYFKILDRMQKNEKELLTIFQDSSGLSGFHLNIASRIAYVKKHGVNVIGVVVRGDAKEILKLKDNPLIYAAQLKNVTVW